MTHTVNDQVASTVQTLHLEEISQNLSLYIKIGEYGTGWIENLAFYDYGEKDLYNYPTSISEHEEATCCFGVRCKNVPKIIENVYPLIHPTDNGENLDNLANINFIWDSSGKSF